MKFVLALALIAFSAAVAAADDQAASQQPAPQSGIVAPPGFHTHVYPDGSYVVYRPWTPVRNVIRRTGRFLAPLPPARPAGCNCS